MYARYISNGHSFASASGLLQHSTRSKGHRIRAKRVKMNNFLVCLGVLSGFSETKKGKSEIYFGFEDCRASVVALHLWRWWCLLGAGGALLLLLFGCVPSLCPAFCPLSCFACRVACEYGFISRFKGVLARFGVQMYVCMGLGLCVDCGAFVCVRS